MFLLPSYVFCQFLINVKRFLASVSFQKKSINTYIEPVDMSPMVLPSGVQFIFNISQIKSPFQFPELVFLWGEEAVISNFSIANFHPILLLSRLSIFHLILIRPVSCLSLKNIDCKDLFAHIERYFFIFLYD